MNTEQLENLKSFIPFSEEGYKKFYLLTQEFLKGFDAPTAAPQEVIVGVQCPSCSLNFAHTVNLSQFTPTPTTAAGDNWISVAKELIDAQKQYIEFLGKVYGDAYTIAYVHHYRFSKEDIDKGREMRIKISDLEKHLLPSPSYSNSRTG